MKNFVKYLFDFILSFFAILVFLPLLILPIALLIKLTSQGPVFFKQKRIGQNKKFFYLIKFTQPSWRKWLINYRCSNKQLGRDPLE